jgi:renal tumor antigen
MVLVYNNLSQQYKLISKIGEGSFSEVMKVRDVNTGRLFAAKRLFKEFRTFEEVQQYSEFKTLSKLEFYPFVLSLEAAVYEAEHCKLTLITNLMDLSLYDYIKDRNRKLPETKCKIYLFQLLQGVGFLHKNGIFHR